MKQLEAGFLTESFTRAITLAPAPIAALEQPGENRTAEAKKPPQGPTRTN